MYWAPESLTLLNSGEKSEVCESKNSVVRTSAPASVAPFFRSGTRSCTHLAFSPTMAIFDRPSSPLTKPDTKPVICRAWWAALIGPTRKMYL